MDRESLRNSFRALYRNPDKAMEAFDAARKADGWKYAINQARDGQLTKTLRSPSPEARAHVGAFAQNYRQANIGAARKSKPAQTARRTIKTETPALKAGRSSGFEGQVYKLAKENPQQLAKLAPQLPRHARAVATKALAQLATEKTREQMRGRGGHER